MRVMRAVRLPLAALLAGVAPVSAGGPRQTPSAPRPAVSGAPAPLAPSPLRADLAVPASQPAGAAGAAEPAAPAVPAAQAQLVSAALPGAAGACGEARAAEPPSSELSAAAAGRRFDGASVRALGAGSAAALAAAVVVGPTAAPAAYVAAHSLLAGPHAAAGTGRRRLGDVVSAHLTLPGAVIAGWMMTGLSSDPATLAVVAAAAALLNAFGMESSIAENRSQIVGGWQASHDQKFRVDSRTGRLKDVRGHRIGEDRHEIWQRGPVYAGERAWVRFLSAGLGFAWLSYTHSPHAALFAAVLTAGLFAHDALTARAKPPFVPSAEDRAHAARFGNADARRGPPTKR